MKKKKSDTIEKRECVNWGPPPEDASGLIEKIYLLRKKDLGNFTVEDLRVTIGQDLSLDIMMPMAIEQLKIDLFAEGHCYPGDLLQFVLRVKPEYWITHPDEKMELLSLCLANFHKIHDIYEDGSILDGLVYAYEQFKA